MSDRLQKKFNLSESQILWLIFFAFLIVRLLYVSISGHDSFELQPDTARYNQQSSAILAGDYNLTERFFITAPFYSYFQAFFKLFFGSYWILALQTTQLLLCSLSGVFLYKTARLIWNRVHIALIAAAIYCFYPFTLWWVHTFGQDMPFQYQLIFTIFFLLKAVYKNHFPSLLLSAILFSVTFLTKSHILLFAPFIPVFIFLSKNKTIRQKVLYAVVFTAICMIFTLPYGLYNLQVNGVYIISSSGQGGLFLTAHNDDIYEAVVSPPSPANPDYERLLNMRYKAYDKVEALKPRLTESEYQKLCFDEGVKWCAENPRKFLILKGHNLYYFLMPGLNPHWYSRNQWLASVVISLPIYILGYFGIFLSLKQNFRKHFWILGLFFSIFVFSVGFYFQSRFRVITIEPFYILYSSFSISIIFDFLRAKFTKGDSFDFQGADEK